MPVRTLCSMFCSSAPSTVMWPSYGYSHKNALPSVDLPHATAPVMPMIWPFFAENEISSRIFLPSGYVKLRCLTLSAATGVSFTLTSSVSFFSSCGSKGLMRFQETCALCTALKSFAALEDFTESFTKHTRNVVNEAILHACQPVPSTFFWPKYKMKNTPAIEMMR